MALRALPTLSIPKAIHKDALYGTLDHTTREWNDGLFAHILRKILDDVRGESENDIGLHSMETLIQSGLQT
jgi:dynein heavy chain 1